MPKIVVHKRAERYIQNMDARIKAQLVAKLGDLARDPDGLPGVKPMAGEWAGHYRLRHGNLRVIYIYDRTEETVVVVHVGPRGDVYK